MYAVEKVLEQAFKSLNSKTPAEILSLLKGVCALCPGDEAAKAAFLIVSSAFSRADRPPQAIKYLSRVLSIDPTHLRARLQMCSELINLGKIERASAVAATCLDEQPDDARASDLLAMCHMLSPGNADAEALVDRQQSLKSSLIPLLHSILSHDDASVPRCFSTWAKENRYRSQIVETYYLKNKLYDAGVSFARRTRDPDRPALSLSSIATYGRFAHTIQNYLAVTIYSRRHGLEVETPEWLGHYFFDIDDPFISQNRTKAYISNSSVLDDSVIFHGAVKPAFHSGTDVDIFSPSPYVFRECYRQEILEILQVKPYFVDVFEELLVNLRSRAKTIISIHVRLGDMESAGNSQYGKIEYRCYIDWLDHIWPSHENPVLFIASDEPEKACKVFEKYSPVTIKDIGAQMPIASYLQDFYVIMNSDLIAITRGSFGLTAAALNRRNRHCYRPNAEGTALVPFDPWKA